MSENIIIKIETRFNLKYRRDWYRITCEKSIYERIRY